jgi:hypothetical protein
MNDQPEWMQTDQDDAIEDAVFEAAPPRNTERPSAIEDAVIEETPRASVESWNVPVAPPEDFDAVLAEHLAQSQKAARFMLTFLYSHETSFGAGLEAIKAASGLMRMSVALAAALKPRPEFVQRAIVEHAKAHRGDTPAPLPEKIVETSQGSGQAETPNIE